MKYYVNLCPRLLSGRGQVADRHTDLRMCLLGALLLAVVGVDAHRHLRRGVTGEVLYLLEVYALLKELRDKGVAEQVRVNVKVEVFERDLVEAEQEIVVASPGLRRQKVERMISLLKPRQEAGIKVTVITLHPDCVRFGDPVDVQMMIDGLRRAGISVSLTDSESEHFAVIDKKLVWHGGMNLLGKEDAWDNLIRVESVKAAAELLEMTKKQAE